VEPTEDLDPADRNPPFVPDPLNLLFLLFVDSTVFLDTPDVLDPADGLFEIEPLEEDPPFAFWPPN